MRATLVWILLGVFAACGGGGGGFVVAFTGVPAKRMGGTLSDFGNDASASSNGFFIQVGSFEGTATFGAGEPNETLLTSDADRDIYVARFNTAMELIWARRAGGTDTDEARGVAATGDDGAIVVGSFSDACTFGAGEANETTFTSIGTGADAFIARYESTGALRFALLLRSTEAATARAVAVLPGGAFVVTGSFNGTINFGLGQPNETSFTHGGGGVAHFVVRFDAAGQLVWARVGGTVGFSSGSDIAVTPSGQSLVCGQMDGMTTFDPGVVLTTTDSSGFLACYEANGTAAWATTQNGAFDDGTSGVAAFPDGSSVVTGFSDMDPVFGPGEANETTLIGALAFAARYTSGGSLVWAKDLGARSGSAVAALSDGSCVVAGQFLSTTTFGAGEPAETMLTSSGGSDFFVLRLSVGGVLQWVRRAGGSVGDFPRYARRLAGDHVLVGGTSESAAVVFGPGEPNETTLTSAGGSEAVVGRFGPDGTLK